MSAPKTLTTSKEAQASPIQQLMRQNASGKVDELSIDANNLYQLLALVVDIHYRNKYGTPFESPKGRGYNSYEPPEMELASNPNYKQKDSDAEHTTAS